MDDSLADLSAPRILNGLLKTRFRHVEVHPSLPSTQTFLVAVGGKDGRVVAADHQTAGKGRAGRSWLDVPGRMLMFSVLIRGVEKEFAPLTTFAAALALGHAIANLGDSQTSFKWPNDVRIGGKKVCGIIGELSTDGGFVVLGVGVNVGHEEGELPPDIEATSIRLSSNKVPRRDDLCVAILRELDVLLAMEHRLWVPLYRADCKTIGSRVRVDLGDEVIEGVAEAVRDDGALIVDGKAVVAGDVVHVR